ncbi:subtilisin-like protease SBT5.3 isoform X2 [Triticum dicoccoides]|uniref:subtilisin-like protease SBT5.3 isoform X2 n=1 Tax=Triticum dicoccoides TaxID=85692 RepID=UPI0018901AC0|nr:subtilisin-like protease SBT5.3 isoform X2 [Triticum dicoccoides]
MKMGRGAGRALLIALVVVLAAHATPASAAPKSYLVMACQRPASWSDLLTPITSQFRIFYIFDAIKGIALQIDSVFVPALKLLPGVAVIEDKLYQVKTTHSWGFLGLEGSYGEPVDVWKNVANFGEGVIIANVDTGVSPISASFRDDGTLPKPANWTGGCQQGYSGCNNKLIGARVFNEGIKLLSDTGLNDTEVNSPWDYEGHGSHTLSTAGGGFVPNVGALGHGMGTAKGGSPRAHAASYKACFKEGCSGLDILRAILTAVEDGVHVLSLSVGSPASDYATDTIAIGTAYAVTQLVVVVAAGGNDGPAAGSISNVAPWMLTVGASTMDRIFPADVVIGAKTITGQSLSSSTDQPCAMISGEKANAAGQSAANSSLCVPGSLDPAKVRGKIVVCTRGSNGRVAKGEVVKDAGGVGMVLCNAAASGDDVSADPHIIPAAHCSYSQCIDIFKYLQSDASPVGEIKTRDAEVGVKPSPVMAAFSSRGPNTITPQILKPDIIAPGVNVIAAYSQEVSPTGLASDSRPVAYMVESGTSMSCPHVAGIAGLLRAKYPKWNPNMVYSAIMTTANRGGNDGVGIRDETGRAATPFSYGSGHVNPARALDPGLVYDTTTHDYLNFICSMRPTNTQGLLPVSLPLPLEELWTVLNCVFHGTDSNPFKCSKDDNHPEDLNYPSISAPCLPSSGSFTVKRRVRNVGGGAVSYTVSITQPPGVTVTVNPSTLSFDGENPDVEKHFKDPEGILAPPQPGHISRLEFRRRLDSDADARAAFDLQVKEEQERRRKEREARVIPETDAGLVEFFLDTDAREIEIEIGRLRPRLNKGFFDHIQREIAQIKFAVTRTAANEDRLIELEAMQKVIGEGVEAYDKLQNDLVTAKERLTNILQSKDRKKTLLDMVERNELNMSILTLLDENIASAKTSNQEEAVAFMEDVRSSMLKYITV